MKQIEIPAVNTLIPLPEEFCYSATIDENDQEIEISDFMVRRACEEMADTSVWPFAPAKGEMKSRPAGGADIIPLHR